MTTSELKREQDGTINLIITIPVEEIQKEWDKQTEAIIKNTEISGFRKGKAPRKLVEEKINKSNLKEDVLKQLLPNAYLQAVQEHKLKPIVSPQIHVEQLEEGKAWTFTAITCELPEIKTAGYKEAVQNITAKSKIILPGQENDKKDPNLNEIIEAVISKIQITIPKILVEKEVERLLAQLLDEIKHLGLSLDQYLASTQKTVEQLKEDYTKKATNDITFEFALQQIAEEEKITVEQAEIDEAITKATDPQEKANLEKNRYLLASILRQQKTLDFLRNL